MHTRKLSELMLHFDGGGNPIGTAVRAHLPQNGLRAASPAFMTLLVRKIRISVVNFHGRMGNFFCQTRGSCVSVLPILYGFFVCPSFWTCTWEGGARGGIGSVRANSPSASLPRSIRRVWETNAIQLDKHRLPTSPTGEVEN